MPQRVDRRNAPALPGDPLAPRWVPIVSLVLALAGLVVSAYLTVEHFTAASTLACPETGPLNCATVTTSPQSSILGVPVALLGLIFFLLMLAVSVPIAWRSSRRLVRTGRLALTGAGVLFIGYLLYTELFVLNAVCPYCTAVHILAVALFAVTVIGTAYADPADLRSETSAAGVA